MMNRRIDVFDEGPENTSCFQPIRSFAPRMAWMAASARSEQFALPAASPARAACCGLFMLDLHNASEVRQKIV
jgi:hypothetical protein